MNLAMNARQGVFQFLANVEQTGNARPSRAAFDALANRFGRDGARRSDREARSGARVGACASYLTSMALQETDLAAPRMSYQLIPNVRHLVSLTFPGCPVELRQTTTTNACTHFEPYTENPA